MRRIKGATTTTTDGRKAFSTRTHTHTRAPLGQGRLIALTRGGFVYAGSRVTDACETSAKTKGGERLRRAQDGQLQFRSVEQIEISNVCVCVGGFSFVLFCSLSGCESKHNPRNARVHYDKLCCSLVFLCVCTRSSSRFNRSLTVSNRSIAVDPSSHQVLPFLIPRITNAMVSVQHDGSQFDCKTICTSNCIYCHTT